MSMTKPDDVPQWAWDKAEEPSQVCFDGAVDLYETGMDGVDLQAVIARAILSAVEEERAVNNEKIFAVMERAVDFGLNLQPWQANALLTAAILTRKEA